MKTTYRVTEPVHLDLRDPVFGEIVRDLEPGEFTPKTDKDLFVAQHLVALGAAELAKPQGAKAPTSVQEA